MHFNPNDSSDAPAQARVVLHVLRSCITSKRTQIRRRRHDLENTYMTCSKNLGGFKLNPFLRVLSLFSNSHYTLLRRETNTSCTSYTRVRNCSKRKLVGDGEEGPHTENTRQQLSHDHKKSKKENVQPKGFTRKTHGKDARQLVPPAGKETVMLEFK